MASCKEQVETGNDTSALSKEAEEAALKAKALRGRIEKFFSQANDKGDSEEVVSSSEPTENSFPSSESTEYRYSLLEAIEQLEGAARALKEVSLDASRARFHDSVDSQREPNYWMKRATAQSEEYSNSQYTEETGTSLEISDYEWEVLTSFKPSKVLRERLLQNISQRRWRDEALQLVHESKHLTMLWNNTF